MQDRMQTVRAALVAASRTFREYEAHHNEKADPNHEKAARNGRLAVQCEQAVILLDAQ